MLDLLKKLVVIKESSLLKCVMSIYMFKFKDFS